MDLFLKLVLLCGILHVTAGQAGQTSGCDAGWELYNKNCYQFNAAKSITWKQSMTECITVDASLIRIYDQPTLTWVTKTMKTKYPSTGFWTGLNDNNKDPTQKLGTGTWKWGYFTPAVMTFIQWNVSPANDGISLCAGMNIQNKLSDQNCAAQAGAVCVLAANPACPFGWLNSEDGSTCYWITNTTDPTQLRTWAAARSFCQAKAIGADLLSVTTQDKMTYLKNTLPFQSQTTTVYWLGLQYIPANKQWQWLAGGTPDKTIVQWQVEPDNVAGVENCGVLRQTGRFSDRDCTSSANYICMKPVYNYTPMDNLGCGPWIRAGKSCYMFSRNKASWADARGQCLKQNGDLMKVDNVDKRVWLSTMMTDPLFNVYWTGLNDQQTEGNYVWADGTPLNNTMISWNQEPNNYKGSEDCALIYNNGEYNDVACSEHAPAICEIPGQTICPSTAWKVSGGSCYLFTDYTKPASLFTQSEAQSYCIQQDKTPNSTVALVSISSKAEKTYIKSQVMAMADNKYGWWTSLTDGASEGFWQFADGSNDPSFINWSVEPSQLPNDDCGFVNWGGNFHERNCKWKLTYICERFAYGQSTGSRLNSGFASLISSLLVTVSFYVTM